MASGCGGFSSPDHTSSNGQGQASLKDTLDNARPLPDEDSPKEAVVGTDLEPISKANRSDAVEDTIAYDSDNELEEESIDGIYTGSQNLGGVELVARLIINGNQWSAVSQLTYGEQEYQNGIVVGSDLYDDSGYIKIGYVSGNLARIAGYPMMWK